MAAREQNGKDFERYTALAECGDQHELDTKDAMLSRMSKRWIATGMLHEVSHYTPDFGTTKESQSYWFIFLQNPGYCRWALRLGDPGYEVSQFKAWLEEGPDIDEWEYGIAAEADLPCVDGSILCRHCKAEQEGYEDEDTWHECGEDLEEDSDDADRGW